MKYFGLIGSFIKNSQSPKIYNLEFKKRGLGWKYTLLCSLENIKDAIDAIRCEEFSSINITAPFKQLILPYLDSVTDRARKIGAVNLVFLLKNKELVGDNTDCDGFYRDIKNKKIKIFGKSVTILGSGGSSRAIYYSLKKLKPSLIEFWNRNSGNILFSSDIVINCTPKIDSFLLKQMVFHSGQVLYDLNYVPTQTILMEVAKNHGARVFNGLGMLKEQAKLNFRIWKNLFI